MTRLELIAGLLVTWGAFRLLAGRATLPTRTLALVFVLGATGSTTVALAIERLIRSGTTYDRVSSVYAGPVEELAKALPLVLALTALASWRRLTLADWSLIGLAGGAGFTFVQWALEATMPETDPGAPLAWHHWLLGSRTEDVYGNAVFVGAASTALVGLLVGLGVRLSRSRYGGVIGLVGLAAAAVDNGAYRYAVGPLENGNNSPFRHVGGTIGALHAVLLHGRLELYLLVGGLLAAGWIEGRWVLHTNPSPRRVLLADEATVPLVVVEWIVAVRRARDGWTRFARTNEYFRRRREYGLLIAQLGQQPGSVSLRTEAAAARDRLVEARRELETAPAGMLVPSRRTVGAWLLSRPLYVTAGLVFLVLFLVGPTTAPHALRTVVFSGEIAVVIVLAAVVVTAMRLRVARRDDLFERSVATTAAGLALLALVGLSQSLPNVMPDYDQQGTVHFDAFNRWLAGSGYPHYGGNPHTLFAAAAFVCACASATFVPAFGRRTAEVPEAAATIPDGGA